MKSKKVTAPQRAGVNDDPATGLTKLLDAIGDDRARMVVALELMNRLLAKRASRRRTGPRRKKN